jgi:hypothetical protein
VEAPTADEMQAIIRRFDRAPLEDRLLRANPAQPSKGKDSKPATAMERPQQQKQQRNGRKPRRGKDAAPKTAFGAELAKAL